MKKQQVFAVEKTQVPTYKATLFSLITQKRRKIRLKPRRTGFAGFSLQCGKKFQLWLPHFAAIFSLRGNTQQNKKRIFFQNIKRNCVKIASDIFFIKLSVNN